LFELTPGNALLIFPYQLHSNPPIRQNDRSTEFLLVTFCVPHLEGQQYLAPLKNTIIPLKENWFKRILQITRSYQNPDEVSEAEAVFNLAGVLAEMAETFPKQEKTEENMEIFTRICDYIKDNFHNGLNVNILAEHFSLSQTTVRRLFSKNFGKNVTPAHFIENVRMQNAIMRLLYSDDSIAEIAEKCGYSNQFGFSRVFRRATGASPREYRTLHKKST
jgi:AraC-like DNA-binding protein